jgi:LemA protein
MPLWLIILLIAVAVIAVFLVFAYNGLVRQRNMVDEAWNQISVQLKRRHDLIPNLVNAVKGYMDFEQETLTRVIEARSAAVTAQQAGPANAGQAAQAENFLTGALRQLFALVENYPDLKANQNFLALQAQLEGTENRIAVARRDYIEAVRVYNTTLRTFPSILWAKLWFTDNEPFQNFTVSDEQMQAPKVDFN